MDRLPEPRPFEGENRPSVRLSRVVEGRERLALGARLTGDVRPILDERPTFDGRLVNDEEPTLGRRGEIDGRFTRFVGRAATEVGALRRDELRVARGGVDERREPPNRLPRRLLLEVLVPLRTLVAGDERGAVARARPTDPRDVPLDTELRAFDRPRPARDGARDTRDGRDGARLTRERVVPLRDLLRIEGPRVPFRLCGPADESATPANNITAAASRGSTARLLIFVRVFMIRPSTTLLSKFTSP